MPTKYRRRTSGRSSRLWTFPAKVVTGRDVDVDITAEVTRNIVNVGSMAPPDGNYLKTWFKTAGSPLNANGSFPSVGSIWPPA